MLYLSIFYALLKFFQYSRIFVCLFYFRAAGHVIPNKKSKSEKIQSSLLTWLTLKK